MSCSEGSSSAPWDPNGTWPHPLVEGENITINGWRVSVVGATGPQGPEGPAGPIGPAGPAGPPGTVASRDTATIYRTALANAQAGIFAIAINTIATYTLLDVGSTTQAQIGTSFSFPNTYTIKYLGPPATLHLTLNVSAGSYLSTSTMAFFIAVNGAVQFPGSGSELITASSRSIPVSIYRTLNTGDEITAYAANHTSANDIAFYNFSLQAALV